MACINSEEKVQYPHRKPTATKIKNIHKVTKFFTVQDTFQVTKKSNIHKSKPKKRGGAIFGVKKI